MTKSVSGHGSSAVDGEEKKHTGLQAFCHFVHFFTDRSTAEVWTAEREDTFVLSLDDGIELGKLWGELVFPDLTAAD